MTQKNPQLVLSSRVCLCTGRLTATRPAGTAQHQGQTTCKARSGIEKAQQSDKRRRTYVKRGVAPGARRTAGCGCGHSDTETSSSSARHMFLCARAPPPLVHAGGKRGIHRENRCMHGTPRDSSQTFQDPYSELAHLAMDAAPPTINAPAEPTPASAKNVEAAFMVRLFLPREGLCSCSRRPPPLSSTKPTPCARG